MEKRLKNYLAFLADKCSISLSSEEKAQLQKELLTQITFFQHERHMHLIVTMTFAILAVMSILCTFYTINISLLLLIVLLLILLIPYIRHYYILENGVQKLYVYYDQLSQ